MRPKRPIEGIPFFIRRKVKRRVEEQVAKARAGIVTMGHLTWCQPTVPMLALDLRYAILG